MRYLPPLLFAAALPFPAWAQSSPPLSDFSLPPAPRETATPRAQGPVDDSAPVPVAPRVIAPRSAASPTPTPRPVIQLPEPVSTTPALAAPVERPRVEPRTSETPTESVRQALPAPGSTIPTGEAVDIAPPPAPPPLPLPAPALPSATDQVSQEEQAVVLPTWLIGLLAIIAALAAAFWWRRRKAAAQPLTIERPLVANGRAADASAPVATQELPKVELTAVKLTRSLMNASLAYRITLRSRSDAALSGVSVAGELVAAHRSQPLENQIASTVADLPQLHRLERLAPGQAQTVEGTLTLPLSNVIPIRQGAAALFVPLLRLVVTADGAEPLARTFVVGLPGQGVAGRLQPFRLDEPPRSYAPVGQRALD